PVSAQGTATASNGSEALTDKVKAMEDIQFQQMREEGLVVQREAMNRFKAGEQDRALELLQDYIAKVGESRLDPERVTLLRRQAEARMQTFRTLKAQQTFEVMQKQNLASGPKALQHRAELEKQKQDQVAELLKQSREFYKQGKYTDAE